MELKYSEILQGAMQMFYRIGIRSVSIDDIAKELHISKKTIYNYFKNKEELIAAMLQTHLDSDLNGYECIAIEEGNNAIDVLLKVSEAVCKHLKDTNHAQVFELKKYYPEQFNVFWELKREIIHKHIKENIEQGISQNLYRSDLNIELVSTLYNRRLEDFSNFDEQMLHNFSFEQVFKTMFENHIRGISNEQGIAYFEKKKKELNY